MCSILGRPELAHVERRSSALLSLLSFYLSSLPHRLRSLRIVNFIPSSHRLDWPLFSLFPPSPPSPWPCALIVTTFQSLPPLQDTALPVQSAEQRLSPVQNVALHPHPSSIHTPLYNNLFPPPSNHHRLVSMHGSSSPAWSRFGHPRSS